MIKFSIIVPVYNRPDEMDELLDSLSRQTDKGFDVMVMEGVCERSCKSVCDKYSDRVKIHYISDNTGRSERRNRGMRESDGDYFMLFDSDVTLPENYIATVRKALDEEYVDCYGGPDSANETFTDIQLAINYSMTSIMTTGGIRGGMKDVYKYQPRAFNMGFSREVFEKTGGYLDMIGEDVDLSMRIREAGFKVKLIREAVVCHKRRITLKGFFRQTNTFGKARILLASRHKGALKPTFLLPSCFVVGNILLVILAIAWRWWCITPIIIYVLGLFTESLIRNRKLSIALLSIVTSYTQLFGYGLGFIEEMITRKASNAAAETLYRQ